MVGENRDGSENTRILPFYFLLRLLRFEAGSGLRAEPKDQLAKWVRASDNNRACETAERTQNKKLCRGRRRPGSLQKELVCCKTVYVVVLDQKLALEAGACLAVKAHGPPL